MHIPRTIILGALSLAVLSLFAILPRAISGTAQDGGSWYPIATAGGPLPRAGHTAVWTDAGMIIWGGVERQGRSFVLTNTGFKYNPRSDSWSAISIQGSPTPRTGHIAVWTGTEMIVWGGFGPNDSGPLDGAKFNPSKDSWTPISNVGAPSSRVRHAAVWTGSEMIIWGGQGVPYPQVLRTGAAYDPAADLWRATADVNAPTARWGHSVVWTGTEMIVWGGGSQALFDPTFPTPALNSGGRYDPRTDRWLAVSEVASPTARQGHTAAWAGSGMIIWGGAIAVSGALTPDGFFSSGSIYSSSQDKWRAVSTDSAPERRFGHTAVWTGSEIIVWGRLTVSYAPGEGYVNSGGRYDPGLDRWLPMSDSGAPDGRVSHTAVWTGSEMVVWGGLGKDLYLGNGGRYVPSDHQETRTISLAFASP